MIAKAFLLLTIHLLSQSTLLAQDVETLVPEVLTGITEQKTSDPLYIRSQEMIKRSAASMKSRKDGSVRSFPNVVKNWNSYVTQVKNATSLYNNFLSSASDTEKSKLQQQLLSSIQPIGFVLTAADHKGAESNKLSASQVSQQRMLDQEFIKVKMHPEKSTLKLLSPDVIYTLKHLPIPIQFSAPAGTEIILSSDLGGYFPNKLSKIKLTANDQGLASSYWLSVGTGVSDCLIRFRSSQYIGEGVITPVVQSLHLIPLDSISKVFKK